MNLVIRQLILILTEYAINDSKLYSKYYDNLESICNLVECAGVWYLFFAEGKVEFPVAAFDGLGEEFEEGV